MSKLQVKKLSLQKGDILVVERGFNEPIKWSELLKTAGKESGVTFKVPVVFVDSIEGIAVIRMGKNAV